MKCIIPDTSAVIINGVSRLIEEENLDYPEIIVPEAVICELEHQANANRKQGKAGLEELQNLQKLQEKGVLAVTFKGKRPTNYDIKYAKSGEIDSIIRDTARSEMGTLLTNDKVQAETAKAQGIPVYYIEQEPYVKKTLKFEEYFDDDTMSIHLKENTSPMAKKGKPGRIDYIKISDDILKKDELGEIIDEILDREKHDDEAYLENEKTGSIVIQFRNYRISIAYPPFSEAAELTVVRPVADIDLEDYELSENIMNRIKKNAEGILIAGSPGAGKSTFVQAIAKFYAKNKKIVKTMESPRDLQLPDEITQYSPLEGSMENTADVLLLVRPDYTIYDELRRNSDFNIFADMRLAGVGMIGVVHATEPISAIQRIASRVELGVIPSVVDTSIYIEDGRVKSVYKTEMTVKVPTGMKDGDLARPVIEIRDFETDELKNEIYTYGEQTIVMDVGLAEKSPDNKYSKSAIDKIAQREIYQRLRKHLPKKSRISVEIVSPERAIAYLPENLIPKIIGKNGKRIADLENEIGIRIGVEPLKNKAPDDIIENLDVDIGSKFIVIDLGDENGNTDFDITVNGNYLFSATTSKKGIIKLKRKTPFAKELSHAHNNYGEITAVRTDLK